MVRVKGHIDDWAAHDLRSLCRTSEEIIFRWDEYGLEIWIDRTGDWEPVDESDPRICKRCLFILKKRRN